MSGIGTIKAGDADMGATARKHSDPGMLCATLIAGALTLACASLHADDNPVDAVVETTEGVVDDIVDGARSATDTITDSATWDRIAGNWKRFKGDALQRWGELTDDDMDQIDGSKESLVGKIQETYGVTRMEAEQEVDSWAADNE